MSSFAVAFLVVNAIALILLPRRSAPLPLIAGACYVTLNQTVELGPFTFTVIRILVAVGALRVIVRGEWLPNRFNKLDWVLVLWCTYALLSGFFHQHIGSAMVSRLGLVYNVAGIYFLLRIFCSSVEDVVLLGRAIAILLAPVALEMLYEQVANHNLFSLFGGMSAIPEFREGRIRSNGPFQHSILAGTVGASTLPLMIGLWPYRKATAIFGVVVCLLMIVTSSSSGPVMTACFGLGALGLWRLRAHRRFFGRAIVAAYLLLAIGMKAPPYYLIARIDVVGGSTGWYRARLIESSIEHLNEWWLGGTDYTRHWMQTPGTWSSDQADITNHYINMGIAGGLPLLLLFVATILTSFSLVGFALQAQAGNSWPRQFVLWSLGSAMFAHAVTFISVSYFDQSFLFLYLTFAAIGSMSSARGPETSNEKASTGSPPALKGRFAGGPRVGRPAPVLGSTTLSNQTPIPLGAINKVERRILRN